MVIHEYWQSERRLITYLGVGAGVGDGVGEGEGA